MLINILAYFKSEPTIWMSSNAFVSGAGDQRFKSRQGQTGYSVTNCWPPLGHLREAVLPGCNDAEIGLAYLLHVSA